MSVMSPIVCCSRLLTILFTVMSARAATVPCVDNFASCSKWTDVCDDQVAAIHICPWTCGKCEQYNDLPRPSCQNKVDTYFCELAADCTAPLHVTLCPLTCGQCELVTSRTSTVTASSTTASTTSPSTSAFTRTSTHTSAHDISTRPATEKSSVVIESTTLAMTSTHSTTHGTSTRPATASTVSQMSPMVTGSATLVTMDTNTSSVPELGTSQTSTVTASSTTASITSPSTSTFTRASTHTSTHSISTRPGTTSTMSQQSPIIAGSSILGTTSTDSTTNKRSTNPATASTVSQRSYVVTESTTLAMISTHSTTNKRSTMSTTTTTTTQLRPSACYQCGDLDRGVPCTDEETLLAQGSQCEEDRPYCMNDIIQTSGMMTIYKRCVNETICNTEWYMESSDKRQCTQYDPTIYTDDLICHLCCYGDDCNDDNVPRADKLYKP